MAALVAVTASASAMVAVEASLAVAAAVAAALAVAVLVGSSTLMAGTAALLTAAAQLEVPSPAPPVPCTPRRVQRQTAPLPSWSRPRSP